MSARFGRNKRRAQRIELAAAQGTIQKLNSGMAMDRGLLADLGGRLRMAEDFARGVAKMVGRNAIAAGMPVRLDYTVHGDYRAYPAPSHMLAVMPRADDMSLGSVCTETMRLLRIEVVRDRMSKGMHARVTLKDKGACYAISDSALADCDEQFLIEQVSREVAYRLTSELKR